MQKPKLTCGNRNLPDNVAAGLDVQCDRTYADNGIKSLHDSYLGVGCQRLNFQGCSAMYSTIFMLYCIVYCMISNIRFHIILCCIVDYTTSNIINS